MGKKKDKKKAIAKNLVQPLDYSTSAVVSGAGPDPRSVLGGGDRELTKASLEAALLALSLADTLQHGS